MTQYLKCDSYLPHYMAYPRFLLEVDICETAKLVYMLLLDRARVSMKNDTWQDECGRVFVLYTIQDTGYHYVGILQLVLTAVLFLSLPLWKHRKQRLRRCRRSIHPTHQGWGLLWLLRITTVNFDKAVVNRHITRKSSNKFYIPE